MEITIILGYLLVVSHILFPIMPIYISLYSNNLNLLLLIILVWFIMVFLWYILGDCFISILERKLLQENRTDKTSYWAVDKLKLYNNTMGELLHIIITISPLIFIFITLYRVKRICKHVPI